MWGCPAEAKMFNPHLGKLDPKTVSCHFIGYPDRSKGYRFYCPDRFTKFVETRHAVFLENKEVSGNSEAREIDLEEIRPYAAPPIIQETVVPAHQIVASPAENSGFVPPIEDSVSENSAPINEPQ